MPVFAIYCGLNDVKYELFVNKSKKLKNLSVNFGIYIYEYNKNTEYCLLYFSFWKTKKIIE